MFQIVLRAVQIVLNGFKLRSQFAAEEALLLNSELQIERSRPETKKPLKSLKSSWKFRKLYEFR